MDTTFSNTGYNKTVSLHEHNKLVGQLHTAERHLRNADNCIGSRVRAIARDNNINPRMLDNFEAAVKDASEWLSSFEEYINQLAKNK